jgi:hypothetical protein
MNILLTLLAIIGGLVCILFLAALFTRKAYRIERTVTIGRPVPEVFNYIRYLKNQEQYSKWVMMDPHMKKEFRGNDGTTGFVYGWDGNNKAGAGEQEITGIVDGKQLNTEVRFRRPFKGIAHSLMTTGAAANSINKAESTTVQWVFSSELKYPANIFLLLTNVEKTLGRDLETSLANLKHRLEQ